MTIKGIDEKDYRKKYYEEHKGVWKDKYGVTSKALYILIKDNYAIYIGSTSTSLYNRIAWHKTKGRNFNTIVYYDFTDINITDIELKQLEYWYMNLCLHLEDCKVHPYDKGNLRFDLLSKAPIKSFKADDLSVKLFRG